MSDFSPPAVTEDTSGEPAQVLSTDRVASVLADFRTWLTETLASAPAAPATPAEEIDLHSLLGQLIALRQEVNLQTRATRAQQELNVDTLERLGQTLEILRHAQSNVGSGDGEERLRPLLKTLIDLRDALALAAREIERVAESVLPLLEQLAAPVPEPEPVLPAAARPAPFWARWLGLTSDAGEAEAALRASQEVQRRRERQMWIEQTSQTREAAGRVRQMLASLIEGYTMSLQRIDRSLNQHELEPIPVRGQPFDPELMEVLEAVSDSGCPAGEVLAEVRRGYLWKGRVFRYAQVRVARS